jgi:hypothetical protein
MLPSSATLRKYNLNLEQWQLMFKKQKGLCFICLKPFSSKRLPCVDHEHATGLVRGLLCTPCNDSIGFMHDNAGWLHRAAQYLDHPPAPLLGVRVYVPDSPGAAGLLEGQGDG